MDAKRPSAVPIYEPPPDPELDAPDRIGHPREGTDMVAKLTLLWRERRFLWRVAWKTAILSAIVSLLLPLHWEGIVKIVPSEGSNTSMMGGILSRLTGGSSSSSGSGMGLGLDAAGLLGVKTPGAFYVEVLKSQTVMDRIIDRFDLQTHYWMGASRFPRLRGTRLRTRKKLKSFTDIEEDKKSGVITLTVTDYDQKMAAQIANAYIEELNRLSADLNASDAHRERIFLESRLEGARLDLDQASAALSQFSSKNAVMDPQTQGKVMMDAAARLQGELIATESELKGLQLIYSADNTRVRALQVRKRELEDQIKKLVGNGPAPAAGVPDSTASSTVPFSMRSLPVLGSRYADLYRQAKIQEAVYEFLTQQYELARIQEAKELPTVRVMDPALPPEKKSAPIRSLIVILSMLGACMFGCVWIIGRAAWNQLPIDDPRRQLAEEIKADIRRFRRR